MATHWDDITANGFSWGAFGKAAGVVNPALGGAIIAGGNLTTDYANGTLSNLSGVGDWAGHLALTGLEATGAGAAASLSKGSFNVLQKWGWTNYNKFVSVSADDIALTIAATGQKPSFNLTVQTMSSKVSANQITKSIASSAVNASKTSTIIGNDAVTLANASRMIPEKGLHQLLVHGHHDKFIVNGLLTSPKEIARTMLESGFKKGTAIRCISCHTGMFSDGAAYRLSRYLKSPVLAPTNKVRILQDGGYEIFKNGIWKQF